MTLVFYDVETTGLNSAFDQILQFASIQTDEDLNEIDRFEVRCRIQPHIIPDPGALRMNGVTAAQLTDPTLPSHYEMVRAIHAKLMSWSPALFIGYNSLGFDEHFLRHALYQTLHAPYLTNTSGNSRSDAIRIMYAVTIFAPGAVTVPVGEDGIGTFRLDQIAPANGFTYRKAHDAASDVEATIHMCRLIGERAPDIWSAFMRFSQKAAVADYIAEEEVFCLSDHFFGQPYAWLVTRVGQNAENNSEHYAFDLGIDPETLEPLSAEDLIERLKQSPKPVRRIRTNASPILMPAHGAPAFCSGSELGEEELAHRVRLLRSDSGLSGRLIEAFEAGREERVPSLHVEEQIYDGFISNADQALMDQFHNAPWEDRKAIVGRLSDTRLRKLGRRLLFNERPALFMPATAREYEKARANRILGTDGDVPWRTLTQALIEIENEMAETTETEVELLSLHQDFLIGLNEEARSLASLPHSEAALQKAQTRKEPSDKLVGH
ncbi:MAG: exonuclease domain-containing protein [Alphaproteobacteria bacterium]